MRARGFTLVELLLALFLFALIALAGVSLLRSAAGTEARLSARATALADLARASERITVDLAQALARPVRDARGREEHAFVGEPDRLLLSLGGGVAQRIEYRLADGRLERRGSLHLDGAVFEPPSILLKDVRRLSFRYHDRARDRWRDRWDPFQPAALPDAVEMTIETVPGRPVRQLLIVGTGA